MLSVNAIDLNGDFSSEQLGVPNLGSSEIVFWLLLKSATVEILVAALPADILTEDFGDANNDGYLVGEADGIEIGGYKVGFGVGFWVGTATGSLVG